MGSDFFCSLTGGHYMTGTDIITDDLENSSDMYAYRGKESNFIMPNWARERLAYTEEDRQASTDFVLLTPCRKENGVVVEYKDDFSQEAIENPNENEVTLVFDIVPGLHPDLGDYVQLRNGRVERRFVVISFGHTFIMTFTSFQILCHVCPELQPHHLYRLFSRPNETNLLLNGPVGDVDYGPLEKLHNKQYAYWSLLADIPPDAGYQSVNWWMSLLMRRDRTEDEIVNEAWMGSGNMWVMVRPDRFPIQATIQLPPLLDCHTSNSPKSSSGLKPNLDSLPFDIYHILCTYIPMRNLTTMLSLN